jgi:hypothetical protein
MYRRVRNAYPEFGAWEAIKVCLQETDLPTLQQTTDLYSLVSKKNSVGNRNVSSGRAGPSATGPTKSHDGLESIMEGSDDEDDNRTGGLFGSWKRSDASTAVRVEMDGGLAGVPPEQPEKSLGRIG